MDGVKFGAEFLDGVEGPVMGGSITDGGWCEVPTLREMLEQIDAFVAEMATQL